MRFEGKDSNDKVVIKDTTNLDENGDTIIERHKYKLMGVCEFTSDRKMSSNIYRDMENDTYHIYTKGADSEIIKVLSEDTDPELINFT